MSGEMDPEVFEELISAWLDDPVSADLRARVEAAALADSALAHLLDQWVQVDAAVRAALPPPGDVAWDEFRAALRRRLTQPPARTPPH